MSGCVPSSLAVSYAPVFRSFAERHGKLGGRPPDWEGVNKFFCSAHFSELPLPFISCRLNANLLTGNGPIAPGDPMDVELLSVALPVAHFVLADKRMELRIKQLGLDRKCRTAVYSMSTIDALRSWRG